MSTRVDIRNMVRQQLGLWPDTDPLAANITTATIETITVTDASKSPSGSLIEIENEVMFVRAANETTDALTVRRGDRGSTAAAHTTPLTVFIYGPHDLTNSELNRAIRDGIHWLYPIATRDIWDESTTTVLDKVSYVIPASLRPGSGNVEELYLQQSDGAEPWRLLNWWERAGDRIVFPQPLSEGRILQFHGRGRFTQPATDASVLDLGDDLLQAVYLYVLAGVVKRRDLLRSQFTGQSALLESRAAGLSELIGSHRDLMRQAEAIRAQHAPPRTWRQRRMIRWGWSKSADVGGGSAE